MKDKKNPKKVAPVKTSEKATNPAPKPPKIK